MSRVLIVEDEVELVDLLTIHIKDLGVEVDAVNDGAEGLAKASDGKYSLIVLDVMLPSMNGLDVLRELRMKNVQTPVMMLTAKSEELDKVLGLELGADDYLTKPFGVREFQARVKALLRRSTIEQEQPKTDKLSYGDLQIDLDKRRVLLSGEKVDLTPKEFDLLHHLAQHPGRSYSRADLLQSVWGYDFSGYEHTVNAHINRLRAKIEKDANQPEYILTVWGIGYAFTDEL